MKKIQRQENIAATDTHENTIETISMVTPKEQRLSYNFNQPLTGQEMNPLLH